MRSCWPQTKLESIEFVESAKTMNIQDIWTELPAVRISTPASHILDYFAVAGGPPFLPVVDKQNIPLGIIREKELKPFIYSFFGRELLTRRLLSEFLYACPTLSANVAIDDLLGMAAELGNPDGVILVENGVYRAVLFGQALLHLFGKHHQDMQLRIAQLQKMEAIATLAGGIAHDLNNLLTPISGCADIILDMIRQGQQPELELITDIQACATRAKESVRRIQSFSRHQTTEREAVHLRTIVEEAIRLLKSSIPKSIEIRLFVDTNEDTVFGNSSDIQQILLNLCNNAAQAIDKSTGQITIRISRNNGKLPGWNLCKDPLEGEYVRLSVQDNGTGISEDVLPQIFVPFFTTKKQGEGNGMGLSVVHGIVTRSRGHLAVETECGRGTTFHVVWPLHTITKTQHKEKMMNMNANVNTVENSNGIRVAVVDDEPAIVRLAKASLSRHGYDVIPFTDSLEALKAIETEHLEYDVLILDQMMPNLTGIELARRTLALNPDAPIIMCTGFTEAVSPEDAKLVGISRLFLKPMNFNDIADYIERELPLNKSKAKLRIGKTPHL
jgi:signal transduction histidine kinase/CheY-like chemotaxis protein